MSDLLKKLNLLIKAGMNDVLDEVQKATPSVGVPRGRLGADIDREVEQLRKQINRALDHEDYIRKQIADIEQDIAAQDRHADDALSQGDEGKARYYLERMYAAERRKTMLESDLKEHQIAAQELMLRVNELDATISEVRHREEQTTEQPAPPAPAEQQQPDTEEKPQTAYDGVQRAQELSQQAAKALSDVVREAREQIQQMNERVEAQTEVQEQTAHIGEQVEHELQQSQIKDDIAARRARLSAAPKQPRDNSEK